MRGYESFYMAIGDELHCLVSSAHKCVTSNIRYTYMVLEQYLLLLIHVFFFYEGLW